MTADVYTKAVLTLIAIMLTVIAVSALKPIFSWILDVLNNPAVQMLLGAVASAVVAVFVIWLSRPKLKMVIGEPFFGQTEDAERNPLETYRALRVVVANKKRFPEFWPRQTLFRAAGSIAFHNADTGANLFDGRQMRGRWASLPQPEVIVLVDGKKRLFPDPSLVATIPEIDIPWGEKEPLDIAVRFDNDDSVAYGWSNENFYDTEEKYRAKKWELPESCLVKVVVRGTGETCTGIYRFRSMKNGDFRITRANRRDRSRVRRRG